MMGNGLSFREDKTKKVVTLANELLGTSKGEIIYISNCKDSKDQLNDRIKFLDLSEVGVLTSRILTAVIEQLSFENKGTEIILIDNLSKMLQEDDLNIFLEQVETISLKSNVKILFGLDREKKYTINSLDIEEID